MKTLVVYYSRTDRTRFVAEKIAQELGADIEEVIDLKKRTGMRNLMMSSLDAMLGKETKISPTTKLAEHYDLIIIGTPVWFTRPTPAIVTYLKKNSLAGKRVALFCTNGGSGAEKALEKMKQLLPNSNFTEPLVASKVAEDKAEVEAKVLDWCGKLKAA